jgi:hypothetical protein
MGTAECDEHRTGSGMADGCDCSCSAAVNRKIVPLSFFCLALYLNSGVKCRSNPNGRNLVSNFAAVIVADEIPAINVAKPSTYVAFLRGK